MVQGLDWAMVLNVALWDATAVAVLLPDHFCDAPVAIKELNDAMSRNLTILPVANAQFEPYPPWCVHWQLNIIQPIIWDHQKPEQGNTKMVARMIAEAIGLVTPMTVAAPIA